MIKNHLKIAIRNLIKERSYSLINIGGLAIGIACFILIFQYIFFEYSFDNFNEHASEMYHIYWTRVQNEGEATVHANTGWEVGPTLALQTPEIVQYTRLHPEYSSAIISNSAHPDKTFDEEKVSYADSTFFQMFSYPLLVGDPTHVLAESGTILLSQSAARKYFGNEDPIGQTLDVRGWISGEYRVSGIFRDVPANSHLQFELLLPMIDLLQKSDYSNPDSGWGWNNFITYVQIRPDADIVEVEKKFTDIYMLNRREYFRQANISAEIKTQPLRDIYLNEDLPIPKTSKGSYRAVYFFVIIGIITLLIALVNYINLATARALNRAREVGVRKVIGARKRQLINQFLNESALTILLSTVFGYILAELITPFINDLAATNPTNVIWANPAFWALFPVIFASITLIAGFYPAFVLSSFKPATILKGKTDTTAVGRRLRHGLVVFQFAVSIVLLAGTVIVYTQLDYMRKMDLGINLEQILTVPSPRVLSEDTDRSQAVETFTQELRNLSSVRQTATSGTIPGWDFSFGTANFRKASADQSTEVSVSGTSIDTSFLSLYDLELVAGENMANISYSVAEGEPGPILINESALQAIGFDTPASLGTL